MRTFRVIASAVAPLLAGASWSWAQLPAFPGAEGFGANATGGRGGDVYRVTSLADTLTPGTLRYGLRESGFPTAGRTIVFDVGGTIQLTSNLDIKNVSKLTIAGQTAPGPGITLTGFTLQVTSSSNKSTNNIVVQHIRSRKGMVSSADDAMGVLGSGNTHTVVLDHVSASWSEDEVLSLTNNSTNVTVQRSFINEGLNGSGHGYASLIRPRINANYSYHHNLVAHHKSRMPRPGSYNGMTTNLDFRNNVLYNWLDGPGYSEDHDPGEFVNMNYVGNYGVAGPSTPANRVNRLFDGGGLNTAIHQSDNRLDSNKNTVRDGADMGWGPFVGQYTQMASPFEFAPVTTHSPEEAYETVLLRSGAMPWARDASDRRVANDVMTQDPTGVVKNVTPAAEWNDIHSAPVYTRPAGWDTDNDGMPNWWELGRGHNPAVADQNGVTASGYTRLENYVNYITNTSAWGDGATGNWSSHANWFGGAPNGVDALAAFVSYAPGALPGKSITVNLPQTVGMIHFDSPFVEYTINGPAPIMLDDSSGIAAINLIAGQRHTIAAPLVLADNTAIVVMPPESTLTLSGAIHGPGTTITKHGPGAVQLGHVRAGGLIVNAGVAQMLPGGSSPNVVNALSIAGTPSAPSAVLDMSDNSLIIDYEGSTPFANVRSLVVSGYAGGSWTGNGITSSTAADAAATAGALKTALGMAEASALSINSFRGEPLDSTALIIAHTIYGDANLDGVVNLADFNRLAANFGSTGGVWSGGDFNYDGVVNLADFNLLAAHFGIAASGPQVTPQDWSALASAVPEPSAAIIPLLLPLLLTHRRRRK